MTSDDTPITSDPGSKGHLPVSGEFDAKNIPAQSALVTSIDEDSE